MAAPVVQPGTPGNLINGVTLAPVEQIAALLTPANNVEFQVTCEVVTGATAPSVITTFGIYKVYGNATPQTLSASSGTSSVVLAAAAVGVKATQKIALVQASGSKLGEIATVTGVSTSVITFSAALVNTYQSGDGIYPIPQAPTFILAPANPVTGTYSASTDYSMAVFLGPAQWIVAPLNGDGAQSVKIYATYDLITAFE